MNIPQPAQSAPPGFGGTHAAPEIPDMREHGALKNGAPQFADRRLFMQLQVFTGASDVQSVAEALKKSGLETVLYADVNDPKGIGVLFMTENPDAFTHEVRDLLNHQIFSSLIFRPEMTMLGRTYAAGREPDLEDWTLKKPRRNALNPAWPWAVWYPLRRKSEFELLTKEEQGKILYEHAKIGISYGQGDFAHDIRLACYGLDTHDNEFVLGLVGKDLHPLSRVVQDMRKTQQTAKYMQSLGPFFVGRAVWQSPLKPEYEKKGNL
jgi:chlorite dismutase